VATPIGNAADLSLRALETLRGVDAIACEDTRVTSKLLAWHGLSASLLSYHEHNAAQMRPRLLERLQRGEAIALVSDAGMPLIADPGYKLVRACLEAGVAVSAVPGANAALMALVLSGLPSDRFMFAGWLPPRHSARLAEIATLAPVPATLILYESPGRLAEALADLAQGLGAREAAVARELTKHFEEVRRGPLDQLAAHYAAAGPPKGEVVLVIAPPAPGAREADAETVDRALRAALASQSIRDAAATVAAATGRPRRQVYARALELAEEGQGPAPGPGQESD